MAAYLKTLPPARGKGREPKNFEPRARGAATRATATRRGALAREGQ